MEKKFNFEKIRILLLSALDEEDLPELIREHPKLECLIQELGDDYQPNQSTLNHISFRNVLASLYPSEQDIRRIVSDAGVTPLRIIFGQSSINIWNSALTEAKKLDQIDDLFNVVMNEYRHNKDLQDVYSTYQRSRNRLEKIISTLIQYAKHHSIEESLLEWMRRRAPGRYAHYGPYYELTDFATKNITIDIQERFYSKKNKRPDYPPVDQDILDILRIKSGLHAQSEVVSLEAHDFAMRDESDLNDGLVPLTIPLRFHRGYEIFLQQLFSRWNTDKDRQHDSLTQLFIRNREALIALLARWKLPGSNWFLPDEEFFPYKVGESLLENLLPEDDSREALLKIQTEITEGENVQVEVFNPTKSLQNQITPANTFKTKLKEIEGQAPPVLRSKHVAFDD